MRYGWMVFKTSVARLLGTVLVLTGAVPGLYFVLLLAREYGTKLKNASVSSAVDLLPELPPAWTLGLWVALALAVLGMLLAAAGVAMVKRQKGLLEAERRRREDRQRRARQYREEPMRLEPFIGPGVAAGEAGDSTHREPGRRVA